MKTKYTKKQIQESIKHWLKVLESIDDETSKIGPQAKKAGSRQLASIKEDLADDRVYTMNLDVVTEVYDKTGNYVGEMTDKQVDQFASEIAKKYHLAVKVDSYHGSGGGWPDIAFTGKKKDLRKMYIEWYCGGSEDYHDTFDEYFSTFVDPGINQ